MSARTLIDESKIESRVHELASEILKDFEGREMIALCVLKGAVFFTTDLVRAMDRDVSIDFLQVSSYGRSTESSGVVTVLKEPQLDMHGKSVLIVEDIIDSGLTLREVHRYIHNRGADMVKVVALLDKKASRTVDFDADYVGFTIDPLFVIGYGLDYDEKYRNLRDIQILEE